MRACLVLVAIAGCGFHAGAGVASGDGAPEPPDSTAAGDGPIGPDAVVIFDGPPDAFVPDAPPDAPGDEDGDGITDDLDNCPHVANHDQHNFDQDSFGDACDPCPHLSSASDPNVDEDADHDGVGNACDPRPATPGDAQVLFEAFYDGTGFATWSIHGAGAWTVSGQKLHQTATGGGLSYVFAPPMPARAYVATRYTVQALGMFTTPQIGASSGNVPNQYFSCYLSQSFTTTTVKVDSAYTGHSSSSNGAWSGTFATGSVVDIVQSDLGNNNCTATQGTVSRTVTEQLGPNPTGQVALFTSNAAADFDYLFVVAIGP